MATNRILMASSTELHTLLKGALDHLVGKPRIVGVEDGARLVNAVTRLLLAEQPPSLIVIDLNVARVGGQSAAVAVRALERAMEKKRIPILLYGPDASTPEIKEFCKDLGATVHLRSHDEKGREDQAKRLIKAMERVLTSTKGARK